MSHVYVTSDWHIGHSGITDKFRTQFPNTAYHDDYILANAREKVTKKDVLYVIGDAFWTLAARDRILEEEFPCKMILVRGNHDILPIEEYLKVFDEVHGALSYKGFWLTHIPIHRQELYRRHNIHGHCHRGGPWETNKESEYFNAILEFNDYAPVNMQQVKKIMTERNE